MKVFLRKLTWLGRRRQKEAELREELQFHLDEDADERRADGIDAADADLAARREFGNRARIAEDTRAVWGWRIVEQLLQDVRYGWRALRANAAFSTLAILSLALGIGANTAILSFMDAILLRSLPVAHPEALVVISTRTNAAEVSGMNFHDDSFLGPNDGYGDSVFAYPSFEMLRTNTGVLADVFGFQSAGTLHVVIGNRADLIKTEYVSGNYFSALGVSTTVGRLLNPQDDRPGAPAVVVLSTGAARRLFGSVDDAAGREIQLNGYSVTVAGVAPPAFSGVDPGDVPDAYIALHTMLLPALDVFHAGRGNMAFSDPNFEWVVTMGRLRPGVSRAQAEAVLAPQLSTWMRTINTSRNRADLPRLLVRDGGAGLNGVRQRYSEALFVLLAVATLILAIACANIANLLLARATARRREIAVRLSLGAGRWRIVRQLLTESVLLASVGGALGAAVAAWGIGALTRLLASGRDDFVLQPSLNWRVLGVTAGISLLTGVLFGLVPALQATTGNTVPALKESRAGRATSRTAAVSRALIALQFALGLVILVAAGLFVRTLSSLESIPLGFNRDHVLTFRLDANQAGHPRADVPAFYNDVRARLAAIPGVRSASLSQFALLAGRIFTGVSLPGQKPQTSLVFGVGPAFHTTMQVPLIAGREIDEHDVTGTPQVAVVNQAFVHTFFNDADPIGQHVSLHNQCGCSLEIVGVSGDVLMGNTVTSRRGPELFFPFRGAGAAAAMTFDLRTVDDPATYANAVRQVVGDADPHLPISELRTERMLVDGTLNREVVFARLCTGFALLALVIACIGLYGTMSYHVARRTSEIGIRMALGAPRRRVVWMILGQVLALAIAGLVIGVPSALLGSKLIASFLYDVKPRDPTTIAIAAAALFCAAAFAGFLPARNASRIDPVIALRHE